MKGKRSKNKKAASTRFAPHRLREGCSSENSYTFNLQRTDPVGHHFQEIEMTQLLEAAKIVHRHATPQQCREFPRNPTVNLRRWLKARNGHMTWREQATLYEALRGCGKKVLEEIKAETIEGMDKLAQRGNGDASCDSDASTSSDAGYVAVAEALEGEMSGPSNEENGSGKDDNGADGKDMVCQKVGLPADSSAGRWLPKLRDSRHHAEFSPKARRPRRDDLLFDDEMRKYAKTRSRNKACGIVVSDSGDEADEEDSKPISSICTEGKMRRLGSGTSASSGTRCRVECHMRPVPVDSDDEDNIPVIKLRVEG